MNRLLLPVLFFAFAASGWAANEIQKSAVRISVTSQVLDFKVPWNPGQLGRGSGSGFVISGDRILTNAHVVSNARFLTVEREGDPKKYPATVSQIGHDCDLAILKVTDPDFFKNMLPLALGGIPAIESTVSVYGYPIGGERMSVTRGIVSRVDFQPYSHSAIDSHLAVQIDAAINPGNSGGPVLQEGKVVGVAFQGYSGDVAQNVGYMIPTPVIERFLKDLDDGKYDRYVDLAVGYFPLQNPGMRRALGLKDDDKGVMISSVMSAGAAAGILKNGDVLLSIDGHEIDSDGFVQLDGERVEMPEIVERKFKGNEVKFKLWRDGKEIEATVTLKTAWPYLMQANSYDVNPRFVMFGGLVFQPLSRDFMAAYKPGDLRVRYFYDQFVSGELYKERPEIVVLSQILADPINSYAKPYELSIVDKINGKSIQRLEDVAAAFSEVSEYYVIDLLGMGRPIVLERAQVEAARNRIKNRYNVLKEQNLDGTFVPEE